MALSATRNDWSVYSLEQLNGMIRDHEMYSAAERAEIAEERTCQLLAAEDAGEQFDWT